MLAISYVYLVVAMASVLVSVAAPYKQTTAYDCEDEWFSQPNGSSCYKIHSPVSDYNDAVETCLSLGAQVITIETQAENDYISDQISRNYTAYIGLKKQPPQWIWQNGRTDILDNWETGHPTDEDCVYLSRSEKWQSDSCNLVTAASICERPPQEAPADQDCVYLSQAGKWVSMSCQSEADGNAFICERPIAAESLRCVAGWDADSMTPNASCYKITLHNSGPSYDTASMTCSRNGLRSGADLVTIETMAENQYLTTLLPTRPVKAYIELRRSHGRWQWQSGDTVVLDNWAEGEPKTSDCATIRQDGLWRRVNCNSSYNVDAFICEKPAAVHTLLTEEIVTEPTSIHVDITTYDSFDQNTGKIEDSNIILYVAIPLAVVTLVTIACILWRFQVHRRKSHNPKEINEAVQLSQILKNMLDEDIKMNLDSLLVHRSTVDIQELVGQGAFGLVYRGIYTPVSDTYATQTVAIKTLKANCIGSQIIGLAEEAGIMANFVHLHILPIIALCIRSEDGVPMLILPYMENGDLRAYLRKFSIDDRETKPPDGKQLLTVCLHIARGMEYLAEQKFVHRDLAARNCMLDNNLIVKIADFGLSRDIYTSSYYRLDQQKCLPVKWLSLESLQFQTFTFHSDVWSFGVTMWEILTLGMMPYTAVENIDMKQHLQSGARLERPEDCSDDMYDVMLSCWDSVAENRPSFDNISKTLADEMAEISGYMDLNMDPNNYASMQVDEPANSIPVNSEAGHGKT